MGPCEVVPEPDCEAVSVLVSEDELDCDRDEVPDLDGVADRVSVEADESVCVIVGVRVVSVLVVIDGVDEAVNV